jgi:hypothetical protein
MRVISNSHHPKGVNMLKRIIAPVVIGGVLLGGVAATGTAFAATPSATAQAQTGKGAAKAWIRAHRKELRKDGLDVSAQTIGITPQVLKADLKAGNSVAGVATQHNVSPQTVINALVSAADNQGNKAVTANKLTSTQANKIEALIPARVTKAVNHTF